jgi:hypothetical protein
MELAHRVTCEVGNKHIYIKQVTTTYSWKYSIKRETESPFLRIFRADSLFRREIPPLAGRQYPLRFLEAAANAACLKISLARFNRRQQLASFSY